MNMWSCMQAQDFSSEATKKPGVLGVSKWPLDHPVSMQHAQDFEEQPVPAERPPLAAVRFNARVCLAFQGSTLRTEHSTATSSLATSCAACSIPSSASIRPRRARRLGANLVLGHMHSAMMMTVLHHGRFCHLREDFATSAATCTCFTFLARACCSPARYP